MAQFNGVVKWFNQAQGYGLLGLEDGPEVFLHYSSGQPDGDEHLQEGDVASLNAIQPDKSLQTDQELPLSAS